MTRYTVFGAGSIGTVLACRLAAAGVDVAICGRGAVGDLEIEGDTDSFRAQVPVRDTPAGIVLACIHEDDIAAMAPAWKGATVVTWSNGVRAREFMAPHGRAVDAVWRITCEWTAPGRARFTKTAGRLVVERTELPLADDLRAAGFEVGESEDIESDKWLKLCANLASTVNALVNPRDHADPAFGAVKAALLVEARDVLATAGVRAASCDGRDAGLDEEIDRQRSAGPRKRPVRNDTWRRLARGLALKTVYHDTIVGLAERHGGTAPRNRAMRDLARRAQRPECYRVDEVAAALNVCDT